MKFNLVVIALLTLMWFPTTATASADECRLTDHQRSIMFFAYSFGREHNVGFSMVAIAKKESDLGRWNINLQDPSASPWHVTVDKAVTRLGWRQTPFNMNRATQRLVKDPFLGASIAVEELKNWYRIHDDVTGHERWRRVWASYNRGYNWRSDTGQRYADDITANIEMIKRCNWLEGVTNSGGMQS